MSRRTMLKGAAALALPAVSALGHNQASSASARAFSAPSATPGPVSPVSDTVIGYAFNAKSQDVTLFDPATQQVLATKPLGAVVRWLSNEQRFWDGQYVWTYDFPDDLVRAIAVDPRLVSVARSLPTGGAGPAHSLMLAPDRQTAWVNVAGGDYLAVIDLVSGEVSDEVKTGKFP